MASFYKADNLKLIESLPKESIDFIYIDPPYYTRESQGSYSDTWESLDAYIDFLRQRITAMKPLLKQTGLIAVQLDWHAVHYVKVMMDTVFGYNNFVNELIWAYKSGGATKRSYARKHDTILVYSKTKDYYFLPQKEKSYNRGLKPYHFKGVEEFQDETGWYTLVNHKDVLNFDMVGRTSSERTGYATQKPEKLLEMLVNSFAPKGGMVADFFAGSGTTAVAAFRNDCDFILCDEQDESKEVVYNRLDKLGIKCEFKEL